MAVEYVWNVLVRYDTIQIQGVYFKAYIRKHTASTSSDQETYYTRQTQILRRKKDEKRKKYTNKNKINPPPLSRLCNIAY
jgi:hypothetical protein